MPPRMGNEGQILLSAGTLLAVAVGGMAVYNIQKKQEVRLKKRRGKKGLFHKTKTVTKDFSHQTIVGEFPPKQSEVESLFERDLPRLEGLSKESIDELVSTLENVLSTMNYSNPNIRTLVLGCCTQSVLAQVLTFLLEEERIYLKKHRPDLCSSNKKRTVDVLEKVFKLFGASPEPQRLSKGPRMSATDDTLLLHSMLNASVDKQDFAIKYNLVWNVVPTDEPEVLEGRWTASFIIKFKVVPNDIAVEASVSAVREDFI